MNKILVITLSALIAVFSISALAYSYMGFNNEYDYGQNSMMRNYAQNSNTNLREDLHSEMKEIFVNGTYIDLVKLREEKSMDIMMWINSEDDFKLAKQEFVLKDKYYQTRINSDEAYVGREFRGRGGCHMRSNYS